VIRIGVAGPPGMLRSGLEALIRADPEMHFAFAVDSLDEVQGGADVIAALDPDLEAMAAPGLPPVVAIAEGAPDFIRAALRAGVRGILPPDCTATELTATLVAAAAGLTALRSADAEILLGAAAGQPQIASVTDSLLSRRETEVLRLLADGLANKEIGYRLGISEHTVKFHVNSILTRLDASSRAEAVALGIRRGLILL
jgi:DNA-binding NarL/FixJ family response regulator